MIFSFSATPDFDFLARFAQQVQAPVVNGLLEIPKWMGEGYIRKFTFGKDCKVVIHRYILREDLTIQRNAFGKGNDLVTLFFYNNEKPVEIAYNNDTQIRFSQRDQSAIQITSNDLSSTVHFPANHPINYVVVGIRAPALQSLLALTEPSPILKTITTSGSSFLFFESMTMETKLLLKHMATMNMSEPLSHFHMHIKVQELMYLLFQKLSLRERVVHHTINSGDAERLLDVRNAIMYDLSIPPVIRELAQIAAMSETKLKQLFKQTFGSTIYNYYQQARMEKAAYLLKQRPHSVAAVGEAVGFTNLSHFSRLFEKHYGVNPKRFASKGGV